MTVEIFQVLSIASFVIAAVLFIVAIVLFFILDIVSVSGELSGRTAKKAIDAIKNQSKESENSNKGLVSSVRERMTDKISASGKLKSEIKEFSIGVGTEKFATATLINAASETTILNNNETTLLHAAANETTVLTATPEYKQEANVVHEPEVGKVEPVFADFVLEVEMSFTGSSEIIE